MSMNQQGKVGKGMWGNKFKIRNHGRQNRSQKCLEFFLWPRLRCQKSREDAPKPTSTPTPTACLRTESANPSPSDIRLAPPSHSRLKPLAWTILMLGKQKCIGGKELKTNKQTKICNGYNRATVWVYDKSSSMKFGGTQALLELLKFITFYLFTHYPHRTYSRLQEICMSKL